MDEYHQSKMAASFFPISQKHFIFHTYTEVTFMFK